MGALHPATSSERKNALSLLQETKRLEKHSAVPLSVAVPSRGPAAHCPPSRAGAVTGTTRPRLLASSFSRRLQGDFRPASPAASHQTAALFGGTGRVTRPYPRRMFHFTGLSYHIFAVCQGGFSQKPLTSCRSGRWQRRPDRASWCHGTTPAGTPPSRRRPCGRCPPDP